jgi:ketosteroid isomerase-like protein
VESARRWLEALSREDFDAALALVHPSIEFVPPGGQPPYRGAESLRRWMEPDAFPGQVIDPLETVAVNDRTVLGRQHVAARGRASGIELDVISWAVWRFDEDGLITRIEIYLEHEEDRAREAAGLSE